MAMSQADRARNYRKRKTEEREAARAAAPPDVTPKKPSRQERRDRARADRVARARPILDEPLPERGELLLEGLRILRSVGLDVGAAENARVSAGKALVDWASGSQQPDRSTASSPEAVQGIPQRRASLDERFPVRGDDESSAAPGASPAVQ